MAEPEVGGEVRTVKDASTRWLASEWRQTKLTASLYLSTLILHRDGYLNLIQHASTDSRLTLFICHGLDQLGLGMGTHMSLRSWENGQVSVFGLLFERMHLHWVSLIPRARPAPLSFPMCTCFSTGIFCCTAFGYGHGRRGFTVGVVLSRDLGIWIGCGFGHWFGLQIGWILCRSYRLGWVT